MSDDWPEISATVWRRLKASIEDDESQNHPRVRVPWSKVCSALGGIGDADRTAIEPVGARSSEGTPAALAVRPFCHTVRSALDQALIAGQAGVLGVWPQPKRLKDDR